MRPLFITLLIILIVILALFFIYYIWTLPVRRQNKEMLKRALLLHEEKCRAERAKQNARIAGEIARDNIDEIAKFK